jgi:hypothetical protein
MSELRQLLYCSSLASDQPIHIVGQIVSHARARNEDEGITGLLVFDGIRFCQHLEGPADRVRALLQRLQSDPRHCGMTVRFEGPLTQRRYPRFDLGLAEVENGEELAELETLEGETALARFLALRPRFDVAG